MRFLADESLDFAIVRSLRSAGHDVRALAEESGESGAFVFFRQGRRSGVWNRGSGRLLMAAHFRFDDVDRLSRALEAFNAGKGEFADYVIREEAHAAGCDRIATFGRILLKETAFIAP